MIILCADDFALSDGVSRGIAELCQARRLSATSALVTGDYWPDQAMRLRDLRPTTAIGLHFNLTLGNPILAKRDAPHQSKSGSFLSLGQLVRRALSRRLDIDFLRAECSAQIRAFRDATGALPDFIDGHQHVHALPVVRQSLIAAIQEHAWLQRPLVRLPSARGGGFSIKNRAALKQGVVEWLVRGFNDDLRSAKLPCNHTFAGFSTFAVGSDYRLELEAALAAAGPQTQRVEPAQPARCHLVMCHPGYVDAALTASGDALVARRQEEFDVLMATENLPARIWQPQRDSDGAIDWLQAMGR